MLESLQEIDALRLNFSDDNKLLLNLTIACIMFGVALELRVEDFRRLFRSPKPMLTGVVSQFLLLPALTFLIVIALHEQITVTVGLGMILVSACPGGNVSNFISALARGNIALSVSLTAFSSGASLLLTPLNFAFWGNLFVRWSVRREEATDLVATLVLNPWDVVYTIVLIIGVPLVLGMAVRARWPGFTLRVIKWVKAGSVMAFLAMVALIFALNFDHFLAHIGWIFCWCWYTTVWP